MSKPKISFFSPFCAKAKKNHHDITVITTENFDGWKKGQNAALNTHIEETGFGAKAGKALIHRGSDGNIENIIAVISSAYTYEDGSKLYNAVKDKFSESTLNDTSFALKSDDHSEEQIFRLYAGIGFAVYAFDQYKKKKATDKAQFVLADGIDAKRVKTFVEGVCLVRDLVNIPANDMGPDELEAATKFLTEKHKLELKVIKDKDLIKKNFPMIYEVGKGSARRPRLLDFSWGNEKHPKLTLVGKGVCFDTGGYDIKPSQFMLTMKKDMGGSAHVLALAHMIISLKLPVRLRVLIPTVENSISGDAYRPSDVLQTRKGITVEIGNTDAEGRLVLADSITYACEEKPELLIDFATLTGAARVAVGLGLPALFCNDDDIAYEIQKLSNTENVLDPVWNLPLWRPYRKELDSPIADICSTGGKAGATTAALFLQEFVEENIEWIHMDVYAWEDHGTPGRPKGGADTGLRAIFAYLEKRYGK